MYWYWRFKRLFAIYIELSASIGSRPFINIRREYNELIVEIPYGYVIITPRQKLLDEHRRNIRRLKHGNDNDEKRNRELSGAPSRASKN